MSERAIILGYSGHALVVLEAAVLSGIDVFGYADKKSTEFNPFRLEYLGSENEASFERWFPETGFIVGIGNNRLRRNISQWLRSSKCNLITVTHPASSISTYSDLGSGCFIARNACINPFCQIGDDTIINTSASIDHECKIGFAAHVGPGAVLSGNVTIGDESFVGANAVVKQGVLIGKGVVVGAGAVVTRDIPDGETWVGNPARKIR